MSILGWVLAWCGSGLNNVTEDFGAEINKELSFSRHNILPACAGLSVYRSRSGSFPWKSQIRFQILTDIPYISDIGKSSNYICFRVNKANNYIEQIVII